jgi:hypothetical protein
MRRFGTRKGRDADRSTTGLPDGLGVYLLKWDDGVPFFVGNTSSPRRRAAAYECSHWIAQTSGIEFCPVFPAADARLLVAPPIADDPHDPMDEPKFWQLVSEASQDRLSEDDLRGVLNQRSAADCAAFAARWQKYLSDLYTWRLWNVAYIMRGGCSDDAFEHFRSWVIAQGETVFHAVQLDPVQWALGQAGLIPQDALLTAELESYVPFELYEEKRGKPLRRLWPGRESQNQPVDEMIPEEDIYTTYPELTQVWGPNT